ncbi:MAG: nucleotidyltransferase [Clostridia bacterium]|nr:nucleotidyltransferase [Clostridia bacterium]
MANNMTLLVMAAGMGSRFGGLKQIEPVGPDGQVILEYSVYDAIEAGFDKAVFIIKKEIETDFRNIIGKRIEKMIDVEYAFQEINKIPAPFTVPEGRVKPWGTGHAVLCAREFVNSPFAVINADDYYGKGGYKVVKEHFDGSDEFCIVGFKLANTVTENGTVSRGICEIENGYLKSVVETHEIPAKNDYPEDTVRSMNMWGCTPKLFDELEGGFSYFLKEKGQEMKSEYLLPTIIDGMIKNKGEKVKALYTDDKWYGVTYKEDKQSVVDALAAYTAQGLYKKF